MCNLSDSEIWKEHGAALETQRFLRNLTATLSQQEMAKEG